MKFIFKALRMTRVNEESQLYLPPTRLSTYGISHYAFTPSSTASPHFGRYSFFVPLRVGG